MPPRRSAKDMGHPQPLGRGLGVSKLQQLNTPLEPFSSLTSCWASMLDNPGCHGLLHPVSNPSHRFQDCRVPNLVPEFSLDNLADSALSEFADGNGSGQPFLLAVLPYHLHLEVVRFLNANEGSAAGDGVAATTAREATLASAPVP